MLHTNLAQGGNKRFFFKVCNVLVDGQKTCTNGGCVKCYKFECNRKGVKKQKCIERCARLKCDEGRAEGCKGCCKVQCEAAHPPGPVRNNCKKQCKGICKTGKRNIIIE